MRIIYIYSLNPCSPLDRWVSTQRTWRSGNLPSHMDVPQAGSPVASLAARQRVCRRQGSFPQHRWDIGQKRSGIRRIFQIQELVFLTTKVFLGSREVSASTELLCGLKKL